MVMARLLRQRLNSYVNQVNRAEADYQQGAGPYNSAIESIRAGTPYAIRNPDGTVQIVGGATETGDLQLLNTKVASSPPRSKGDFGGLSTGTKMYALDGSGNVRQYWMDIAPGGSGTLKVYSSKTTTPFMPDRPELVEPKQPNLTVSNINELKSPSSDQAGLALQAAIGLQGKSQLAGDVANSKVSAFADPEDPNDMASRGILARTLAGQLG